jgi:hypothetical protein
MELLTHLKDNFGFHKLVYLGIDVKNWDAFDPQSGCLSSDAGSWQFLLFLLHF